MNHLKKHRLVPHPLFPARGVRDVSVEVRPSSDFLHLAYRVEPAGTLLLPERPSGRSDGLWRSTCFELFLKEAGSGAYREFNFSPSGAWNAYAFSDWRMGMKPLDVQAPPHLVDSRLDERRASFPAAYEMDVTLGTSAPKRRDAKLSLTAVIEETDGTKSYWALAHPPGNPNFHHPDCFALELAAPEQP